jgi:hypothetical protein
MKHGQYTSLVQAGTARRILREISNWLGVKLTLKEVTRKIKAREATVPRSKTSKEPKFLFTKKFFTKLELMPSVELEVTDSRSKIRRECYGFRDQESRERVYLKIDGDSVIEFRDSPAGFIIGKRYIIPRLEKMYLPKTWKKVNRLMTRVLSERGIIVNSRLVKEYTKRNNKRYKLANLLIARRLFYMKNHCKERHTYSRKGCLREKTW